MLRTALLTAIGLFTFTTVSSVAAANELSQADVAELVTPFARLNQFPRRVFFDVGEPKNRQSVDIEYTFDQELHAQMAEVYLRYQPDYATIVAIDLDDGAIINLTSFVKHPEEWANLALRAEYPAASVFKIVTAAAALDTQSVTPELVVPFNGKSTTLYKNQVLRHRKTKWTRTPTFKQSFAKSVNPVFARVGIEYLGAEQLQNYASRFGFNKEQALDILLPPSEVNISMEEDWEIAEAASGFTKDITLSPLHAVQLAAAVANQGRWLDPYMVKRVENSAGKILYRHRHNDDAERIISQLASEQMRELMRETVRRGSARASFADVGRYKLFQGMDIGGKTGSLSGLSPAGRHEWFVGYASKNGKTIAFASLIVNKEKWVVRSAYVARQLVYHYFSKQERLAQQATISAEAAAF